MKTNIRLHPEFKNLSEDSKRMVEKLANILFKYRDMGSLRLVELVRIAFEQSTEYRTYPNRKVMKKTCVKSKKYGTKKSKS